jgi:hypothetical protein
MLKYNNRRYCTVECVLAMSGARQRAPAKTKLFYINREKRNSMIYDMKIKGKSMKEIAVIFGMCSSNVSYILKKFKT